MLSYDAEVLTALVAQYNREIWPTQIAAVVVALLVLASTVKSFGNAGRLIGLALAAGWAITGGVFFLTFFAPLNFAAPVFGWCFIAQAALLLWSLVIGGRKSFRTRNRLANWAGFGLLILALVFSPIKEAMLGANMAAVELPGLMPDPTAVFTVGLLLMVRGRAPLHLVVLPVLWMLTAAVTAWQLEAPGAMVLPTVGIIGAGLIVWNNRRARAS